ncbi:SCO-spondin-like [Ruditapes philippinarum]|uniref:SCO-spondin-like n=1 Tax=Ruditapes philippinarum TaxID=129788 RepID=UPI00295C2674|nr:SCO-spondin-like [Ruditapes philippinarum]
MFLKVMKCELILLLVFKTVIAVTVLHVNMINFELEYSVTYENWCKSDKDRFQFIIGISIEQCVAECGARGHCSSLIYRSQINGCELFLSSETEQSNPGECVHVKKDDIKVIKSPCQGGCEHGDVCESIDSKTEKCKIKECINITAPTNGKALGNQRGVGNKIRYICNPGYEPKNGVEPVATCLYNAQWSHITECVKTNYTWATWSPWSTCSVSCDSGTQIRSRECSIRIESNGELSCDQSDVQNDETQPCYVRPCPTHGKGCLSDLNCLETQGVCIQRKCFCHQQFAYNNSIKNCTKVCQTMTTGNYTKFERKAITGFNSNEAEYGSLEECKIACTENPECLSFEIYRKRSGARCTTG